MKKIFILLFVIIFIAIVIIFYPKQNFKKRELITELTPLECNLNKEHCFLEFNNKEIEIYFQKQPLEIMVENTLHIKNLGKIDNLNARFYGLNMYMGDIVEEFSSKNNKDYYADLVFSACAENIMRYRLELFSGEKSLNLYIDFDVKR
ncbi:hypothetical protein AVCANL279_01255 [Campylobacter canadensis]|uniref:hypothetical protein n=1 Tax=Campylobacter canadensis TaxID=449520 RepID=UPI001555A8E5|nr:hypothetical protein [Campylobacter canadensis]MBZ7994040.1 hypothetical protein [Campylobacter canadensis]MBZ7995957.1 hypothetical protein [Campylobacter canadensis]MBZ7999371.1 hypothetical protein [Campylobacter canadensis]MBZ8001168.1 hypothetical protein [Campylobacter canadensis]MBZ8003697.1 hypothetical protein [Campylobacter canadensis]